MNTRGVIGKRIVAVKQRRVANQGTGGISTDVDEFVLENGWKIRPVVSDCTYDGDYAVDFVVAKPPKASRSGTRAAR